MKIRWSIINEFGKKIFIGNWFAVQDELSYGFDAFDGATIDADEAVILFGSPTNHITQNKINTTECQRYKDCLESLYEDLSKNFIHRREDYELIKDRIGKVLIQTDVPEPAPQCSYEVHDIERAIGYRHCRFCGFDFLSVPPEDEG